MAEMINYVLLDAARIEWQMPLVLKKNNNHETLYAGRPEEELAGISPYLFSCSKDSNFKNAVWREAKGNSWGIYIESAAGFDELFQHFGEFVRIKTENGRELYFRFYDPRVLHIYLPTCTSEELKSFFGPVTSFLAENENPDELTRFTIENGMLKTKLLRHENIFDLSTESTIFELDEITKESDNEENSSMEQKSDTPPGYPPSKKWDFY